MNHLRWALVIAAKDLRIEFRGWGRLLAMAAFVVLAGVLFSFSLDTAGVDGRDLASGLIWLTILFASTLGLARTFDLEEEDEAFRHVLMSPVSRASVFVGKAAANLVLVWAITILGFVAFVGFLDVRSVGSLAGHTGVFLPGTIGLVVLGTFFSRVSSHSRLGDTLLPVLTFPLLLPVVFFGSTASARVFTGRPWSEISAVVNLLWAFAIGSTVACSLLFNSVAED